MSAIGSFKRNLNAEAVKRARETAPRIYREHLARKTARNMIRQDGGELADAMTKAINKILKSSPAP